MMDFIFHRTPLVYLLQSLWRDEAYSVLFSRFPIHRIVSESAMEPPIYYILLHGWMRLFGDGEIAVRMLSVTGFALACVVVIFWAEGMFGKHWLSWFTPVLFFFNPMHLYYAFEARAYGWYLFFSVLTVYAYSSKRWRLFAVAAILSFYTHLYAVFTIMALAVHFVLTNVGRLRRPAGLVAEPFVRALVLVGAAMVPWIVRLASIIGRLRESWYYPVDLKLIKSVLGNMFLGYEGTPWFLWDTTATVSLAILVAMTIMFVPKKTRGRALMFALLVVLPLVTVIGISFVKPLYVNRYLIPVTAAINISICLAIAALPERMKAVTAALLLGAVIWYDCTIPQFIGKPDFRAAVRQADAMLRPGDAIYADDALVLYETMYYAKDPAHVFLYNPTGAPFKWYIGESVYSPSMIRQEPPAYPARAFVIGRDAQVSIRKAASMGDRL